MFDSSTSLFGYQSNNPVDCAAYDMMVMQDMGILDPDRRDGDEDSSPASYGRRFW